MPHDGKVARRWGGRVKAISQQRYVRKCVGKIGTDGLPVKTSVFDIGKKENATVGYDVSDGVKILFLSGGQTAKMGGKRDTEPNRAEIVDTVSFLVHKENGAYT